jgi:arabinogalactan endo-1,4-beta-galactosidase
MRVSDAFPSEYLRAADLQGRQIKVVISHVEMRDVGDDHKPAVFFQGKDKGCILNKTNANNIAAAYGDDTEDWTGKEVVLYEAMVDFQGRSVPAIRIRPPNARERAPQAKPVTQLKPVQTENPAPGADMDDDIPF